MNNNFVECQNLKAEHFFLSLNKNVHEYVAKLPTHRIQ